MHRSLDSGQGMLVGLAVGDAMGVPAEFKIRGTFEPITGLIGGGVFALPVGAWTDDTSMALCLADSLLALRGYDSVDVMNRYAAWWHEGYRSSTGHCFDIGGQTSDAIYAYEQAALSSSRPERTERAGNGSIMRLAPIVMAGLGTQLSLEQLLRLAGLSAKETHYSYLAEVATEFLALLLVRAWQAEDVSEIWTDIPEMSSRPEWKTVEQVVLAALTKTESELVGDGFVLHTLEVAVWGLATCGSFEEGLLKVVNLGGDADTNGAVYGQLAGAFYGLSAIPAAWVRGLVASQEIVTLSKELCQMSEVALIKSRFED